VKRTFNEEKYIGRRKKTCRLRVYGKNSSTTTTREKTIINKLKLHGKHDKIQHYLFGKLSTDIKEVIS
jgi:hypothetical protein